MRHVAGPTEGSDGRNAAGKCRPKDRWTTFEAVQVNLAEKEKYIEL